MRSGDAHEDSAPLSFTERLRRLFDTVPDHDGHRMSVRAVCAAAAEKGHEISEPYLYQLTQGRKSNPSMSAINAIAAGFGVPPQYFFDESHSTVHREIELLRMLADTQVSALFFRTLDLSPENLDSALEYVRYLRHKQGLPEMPERLPELNQ